MSNDIEISQKILNFILKYFKITQAELSRKLGVNKTYVSNIITGEKGLSKNALHLLKSNFPELSFEWLMTGEGNPFIPAPEVQNEWEGRVRPTELPDINNVYQLGETSIRMVPLIDIPAYASFLEYAGDFPNPQTFQSIPVIVTKNNLPRNTIAFEIKGDSMEPEIRHGDVVVCTELHPNEWKEVSRETMYIVVTSNQITLKFLRVIDKEGFELIPLNKKYTPYVIPPEIVRNIYKTEILQRRA